MKYKINYTIGGAIQPMQTLPILEYETPEEIYDIFEKMMTNLNKLRADDTIADSVKAREMSNTFHFFDKTIEKHVRFFNDDIKLFIFSLGENNHPKIAIIVAKYLDIFKKYQYLHSNISPLEYLRRKIKIINKKFNETQTIKYYKEYFKLQEIHKMLLIKENIIEINDYHFFIADYQKKFKTYKDNIDNIDESRYFNILKETLILNIKIIKISDNHEGAIIKFAINKMSYPFLNFLITELGLTTKIQNMNQSIGINKMIEIKESMHTGIEESGTLAEIKKIVTDPNYVYKHDIKLFTDVFELYFDRKDPKEIITLLQDYNENICNINIFKTDGHYNIIRDIVHNKGGEHWGNFLLLLDKLKSIDRLYFNIIHFAIFFQDFTFIKLLIDKYHNSFNFIQGFIYEENQENVNKPILHYLLENKKILNDDDFYITVEYLIEKSGNQKTEFINQLQYSTNVQDPKQDFLIYLINKKDEFIESDKMSEEEFFNLLKLILNTKVDLNSLPLIFDSIKQFDNRIQEEIIFELLKLHTHFEHSIPEYILTRIHLNINGIDDIDNVFVKDWESLDFVKKNNSFLNFMKENIIPNLTVRKKQSKERSIQRFMEDLDETVDKTVLSKSQIKKAKTKAKAKAKAEAKAIEEDVIEEEAINAIEEEAIEAIVEEPYMLSDYWNFLTGNPSSVKKYLDSIEDPCTIVGGIFNYYSLGEPPLPEDLHTIMCKFILILGYLSKYLKEKNVIILFKGGKAIQKYTGTPSNDIDIILYSENIEADREIIGNEIIGNEIINFFKWYFNKELEFEIKNSMDENSSALKVKVKKGGSVFSSVLDIGFKYNTDQKINEILFDKTKITSLEVEMSERNLIFYILSKDQLIEERKYIIEKYMPFVNMRTYPDQRANRAFLKKAVDSLTQLIGEEEYTKFITSKRW